MVVKQTRKFGNSVHVILKKKEGFIEEQLVNVTKVRGRKDGSSKRKH